MVQMLAVLLATVVALDGSKYSVEEPLGGEKQAVGMKDESDFPSSGFIERKAEKAEKKADKAEAEAEAQMLSFASKDGKTTRKVSRSAARASAKDSTNRCTSFFSMPDTDDASGIGSCDDMSWAVYNQEKCNSAYVKLTQVTSPTSMDAALAEGKYDWRRVYLAGCSWDTAAQKCAENAEGFICERHDEMVSVLDASGTPLPHDYQVHEVSDSCPDVCPDCASVRDNGLCNCASCVTTCDAECQTGVEIPYGNKNMYGPTITRTPARDWANPLLAAGTRNGQDNNGQYPAAPGTRSAVPPSGLPATTGADLPSYDRRDLVAATPITVEPLHPGAETHDHNGVELLRADRLRDGGRYTIESGVPRADGSKGEFKAYEDHPRDASLGDPPGQESGELVKA